MDLKHQNINMERLVRILSGEADSQELEQHRLWLHDSEENRNFFKELQETWISMDKTSPEHNIDLQGEWVRQREKLGMTSIRKSRIIDLHLALRLAASILLIIGISLLGWLYFSPKTTHTGIAETTELVLPDGSQVSLNASSSLSYERSFGKQIRKVSLTGEAFFKVTKNPKAPFIIDVNETEVKVLGTAFNIRSYKETGKVEVTVTEGTVSFYKQKEEHNVLILKPGEKARFDRQTTILSKHVNEDRNFIAWKTKLMIFDNDSLKSVVNTLENVYHRQIILDNADIGACRITTSFDNKDLSTVLKVLGSTLAITSEEKEGKIILKGKGCL